MSQFSRRESPPSFEDYRQYRPFLRRDFRYVCAYCERTESVLGGEEFFEIDHFRPVEKFPEHETHYPNLYYACGKCNRHKGGTWPSDDLIQKGFHFADPCQEDMYSKHLEETQEGALRARTNSGAYTCGHLRTHPTQSFGPRSLAAETGALLPTICWLSKRLPGIWNSCFQGRHDPTYRMISSSALPRWARQ